MTFGKKINILEYAFGEGGGGHQKAYVVYAFINVDNCERPLIGQTISVSKSTKFIVRIYVLGGPYDSYLSGLNRGLPDLIMTVIVVYILHRLHPFHVTLYLYVI